MDETRVKILTTAFTLFTKYGIRNVSMDDIAREMGISKKTLYQHIDNKAELLYKTMNMHFEQECSATNQIFTENGNAIDEMLDIAVHVSRQLSSINPITAYEIKKYYPDCWTLFEQHRTQFIGSSILNNLHKGIEQGMYRNNLKPDLVVRFYLSLIENIIDPNLTEGNYAPLNIFFELITYHLHAITTTSGLAYCIENIEKVKQEQYAKYF
jgi:AcrR family transcriptional regulator